MDGVASSAKADTQAAKQAATSAAQSAQQAQTEATYAKYSADRAEQKSLDTQQQLDGIIIENGQNDAEIVQARGNETLLYKRLDKTDRRIEDLLINIKDFNHLVSNGDWTNAINSAINFLNSAGGGILYFPRGEYGISNRVVVKSKVHLRGVDKSTSIIFAMNTTAQINFTSTVDSSLTDLSYDGKSLGSSYNFVWIRSSKRVRITNVNIYNTVKGGIWVDDIANGNGPSEDIEIKNCTVSNVLMWGFNGVAVISGRNVSIVNCTFDKCGVNLEPAETYNFITGALIKDCTISNTERGVQVYGYHRDTWGSVVIENNTMSNVQKGVIVKYTDAIIKVSGNRFVDVETCVYLDKTVLDSNNVPLSDVSVYKNNMQSVICAVYNNRNSLYFSENTVTKQKGNRIVNVYYGDTLMEEFFTKGVVHCNSNNTPSALKLRVVISSNYFYDCLGPATENDFYILFIRQIPTAVMKSNEIDKSRGIIAYVNNDGVPGEYVGVINNKITNGLETALEPVYIWSYYTTGIKNFELINNTIANYPFKGMRLRLLNNVRVEGNNFYNFASPNNPIVMTEPRYASVLNNVVECVDPLYSNFIDMRSGKNAIVSGNCFRSYSSTPDFLIGGVSGTLIEKDNILDRLQS
ncbi:hypothetical protein E4O93_09130 [Diaphorobacter sp. DS2]|nr:hypothetical protein E4O93_09130 [Diaphorobacter sp. DS2]